LQRDPSDGLRCAHRTPLLHALSSIRNHPVTILLGIPSAAPGALLALRFAGPVLSCASRSVS
jgi:hypothetical protein